MFPRFYPEKSIRPHCITRVDSMAQLPESGRRLEDCRTPKAGAIADIMHVRENVTGPRRLRRFTVRRFPVASVFQRANVEAA
jgi:hypothetical protein